MSEETSVSPSRCVLHLVIGDFPASRMAEMVESEPQNVGVMEILPLTESNAREALEKIFAADTVAVWGNI
jgi:hypothetical protein